MGCMVTNVKVNSHVPFAFAFFFDLCHFILENANIEQTESRKRKRKRTRAKALLFTDDDKNFYKIM